MRAGWSRAHGGAVSLAGPRRQSGIHLDLTCPLYGIRWALMMLNEFAPAVLGAAGFSGKGGY
jgi:hypothetical protein